MSIYDVTTIENEIDRIASENEGEIPEELLQELVEAQTKDLESIEKLCGYVRHLQQIQDAAKAEVDRITRIKQVAANKEASIKKYLLPYLQDKGKVNAGLFKLSIRESEKVILEDYFNDDIRNEKYGKWDMTFKPDKKEIKKALKSGEVIPGASIIKVDNVQVKL